MWRCINDYFGYCSEEPEWSEKGERKTVTSGNITVEIRTCKLDPATCGRYQTFSEQVDAEQLEQPKTPYTHKITPKKAGEVKKEEKVSQETLL